MRKNVFVPEQARRGRGPNSPARPTRPTPVETKAADWWAARQRGERLPEHELPEGAP
jgi:hypothetical protein